MITFWNRKEVYTGHSMAKCSSIRSILSMNGIKYVCKTVSNHNSRMQPGARSWGSLGEKAEFRYLYYVYVHKMDYDKTCKVLADE